ncbi:MAG: hypothetical protein ACK4IA_17180 [Paracoccus hibiscisoli]|uniref:hypothetical protein n=1 Tax=Paracoccus hibiscisoli TaxID=2023261 RepID=UPI00391963F3
MSMMFEELDYAVTPIGAVSLRRRRDLRLDLDVYEIKLGEEFLMTSLFTASEIALARLGMAACQPGPLDVVVGGLGLGYTAQAALDHPSIDSLLVVEFLQPVIDWHQSGILPMGTALASDPRCRLVPDDFFAMAAGDHGFDPDRPGRRFDAILVDIDHSPDALLDARSTSLYHPAGLERLRRHLKQDGVFGLWSDDAADPQFLHRLQSVFTQAWAEPVTFANPLTGGTFTQTVYLARNAEPQTR